MRYALPLALALLAAVAPLAQPAALPFTLEIVERDRPAFPALHSFAEAHHGGR